MKGFFKDGRNILICLLSGLAICLIVSYGRLNRRYSNVISKHANSVASYENKIGELYASNTAYITDLTNLRNENEILYEEVKNLKGNPLVVTETKLEYVHDSIIIENMVYADTVSETYVTGLAYADKWTNLSGKVSMDLQSMRASTVIDTLSFTCDLVTDFVEKDGKLLIVAKSDNPYMRINNLDGYVISPEKSKILKKRFNRPWGVMIGIGGTATYTDGAFRIVPGVNLTVGYKILSF